MNVKLIIQMPSRNLRVKVFIRICIYTRILSSSTQNDVND